MRTWLASLPAAGKGLNDARQPTRASRGRQRGGQGFTRCFLVTFNDDAGRAVYLPHPAHKAFVKLLKPQLDKVLVIGYVAR